MASYRDLPKIPENAKTEESSEVPKIRKSQAPRLTYVQRSNFRMGLYCQLKIIKRTNVLDMKRQEEGSKPSERSAPIPMLDRRRSDANFVNREEDNLRKEELSQSDKESDNEDIFALDIEI